MILYHFLPCPDNYGFTDFEVIGFGYMLIEFGLGQIYPKVVFLRNRFILHGKVP